MFSFKTSLGAAYGVLLVCVLLLLPPVAEAMEFEASTAPDNRYVIKVYPHFFYTSAYFTGEGKASNLDETSGLLHFRVPANIQYGITGAFSIGGVVPIDWTYREEDDSPETVDRLTIHELWVTMQYRCLTCPFIVAASLRTKIPLAGKEPWEDGLRIGDDQIDLFPVAHFDYFSSTHYWYVQLASGYKYRFKKGEVKPHDEFRFYLRGGYELFPDLRMRFYLYADLTQFINGEYPEEDLKFYEKDGDLHTFGYGVSLWPRPTFRVDITTGGDWSGTNRYRGMHWIIGFTKIL
jgi:hypothetical protein